MSLYETRMSIVHGQKGEKMPKEWIISEEDLGCDGAYFSYDEVVRCKDCIHYWKNNPSADIPVCLASPKAEAFCSEGERREDAETD